MSSDTDQLKRKERKQITMTTNTAFLLNTWFPDKSEMWKEVKDFIELKHPKRNFIKVTFKEVPA